PSTQPHVAQPPANVVDNTIEPQSPAHATSSHQHVPPTTTTTHGTPFIPPHAGRVDALVTVPAVPAALPMLAALAPGPPPPPSSHNRMPPHPATPHQHPTPTPRQVRAGH